MDSSGADQQRNAWEEARAGVQEAVSSVHTGNDFRYHFHYVSCDTEVSWRVMFGGNSSNHHMQHRTLRPERGSDKRNITVSVMVLDSNPGLSEAHAFLRTELELGLLTSDTICNL